MESARLEKYKKQYKFFDQQIGKLQGYLSNLHDDIIRPDLVSRALAVNEYDAIFLLSLAENENLVHKKYFVFTKNENNPLGEFDTSNSIPHTIVDNNTGREVYRDDYYVDLAFEVA